MLFVLIGSSYLVLYVTTLLQYFQSINIFNFTVNFCIWTILPACRAIEALALPLGPILFDRLSIEYDSIHFELYGSASAKCALGRVIFFAKRCNLSSCCRSFTVTIRLSDSYKKQLIHIKTWCASSWICDGALELTSHPSPWSFGAVGVCVPGTHGKGR